MTEQISSEDQVISRIKENAHWRVVLHPGQFKKDRIGRLSELWKIVEETQVRFRGWYYPHISHRGEERGQGIDYIGCWSQYLRHTEHWRFYQSGQFAHLFTFRENDPDYADTLRRCLQGEVPLTPQQLSSIHGFVSIVSAVYTFTEIFELAGHLAQREILHPDCQIIIGMHNIQGYALSFSTFNRALYDLYIAQVNTLEKAWTLNSEELVARVRDLAVEASLWFFERFGMEVIEQVVADMQASLFR
ncbi:MAG: hypothetical protein WBW48_19885 [Anaerolineae bacterium]